MASNLKIKSVENKSAQDIQDEIFRKMSAERKIKLASDFFRFARELNPKYFFYGTGRTASKNLKNS